MASYKHHVNTHHRSKQAHRVKRVAQVGLVLIFVFGLYVGIDWLIGNIRASKTVVSSESSATVQSAQINIFRTPFFQFQANSKWREVTDELNLKDQGKTRQYLYRNFDNDFIEHELWVTVNLPENYVVDDSYIPTRVVPVRIESDGSLTQIGSVSDTCLEVLPKENPNLESHVVIQNDIEYFCNPNEVNDYHVIVGVPGGKNQLKFEGNGSNDSVVSITHINVTAIPSPVELENILSTFKLL